MKIQFNSHPFNDKYNSVKFETLGILVTYNEHQRHYRNYYRKYSFVTTVEFFIPEPVNIDNQMKKFPKK